MRFDIIPMELNDVAEASALEAEVFSMPWKAEDFAEMVAAPYAYYFVAKASESEYKELTGCENGAFRVPDPDGKVLAGIIGLRDIAGEGEITNVAVDPRCRKLGIGSALVERALKTAGGLGIDDISLEVRASNIKAIGLYEKYGFVSEGVRPGFYDQPKEDALIMWRRKK